MSPGIGGTKAGVKSQGVELEIFTRPMSGLSWNFGAVYADTKYRDDLVGFEVKNMEHAVLGVVDHFVDTPGNAVMVIRGAREYLVPVTAQHLRQIAASDRTLIVDWPEDF